MVVTVENQGNCSESVNVTLVDVTNALKIASRSVTLSAEGQCETADKFFDGEGPTTQFGNGVEPIADVNGDGYGDVLVGGASRWSSNKGRAYLYYGGPDMDENADKTFTGESNDDYFAEETTMGDINGDGFADVIVGAPGYSAGSFDGRVYIYYGGPDMDENADLTIDGESGEAGWFGRFVDSGDVDNDGCDDLLVSANHMDSNRGRVYIYYGGTNMDIYCDQTFEGENAGDLFGKSLALGKDVNGDNCGDVLIGSWNFPGGDNRGRAYLYYGSTNRPMDNACDKTFTGENTGDVFSNDCELGDLDNDNLADVLIGAVRYAGNRGRVYIYWGESDITVDSADLTIDGEPGNALAMFGVNIDCGDVNNDGHGDILVGGVNYYHNDKRGRAYVYYGDTKTKMNTDCDHTFTGKNAGDRFGNELTMGDINGDGFADLVVGAYGHNNFVGRVYLYYSGPGNSTDVKFDWDTIKASKGEHILKAEIVPVAGEEDTADNSRTITVNVKAKVKEK
jgi:hypothetical protein